MNMCHARVCVCVCVGGIDAKVGLSSSTALQRYGQSIVSYVADYGTEAKFIEAGQHQFGVACVVLGLAVSIPWFVT